MQKGACELCRGEVDSGEAMMHSVVPREVAAQAGMPDSKAVKLCAKCRKEVEAWYLKKVSDVNYDWRSKRFVAKSPADMVKEYEAAYAAFMEYKKRLLRIS